MRGAKQIQVVNYRNYRFEVLDDRATGWIIIVHAPDRPGTFTLRNHIPSGLPVLLAEARAYVDRFEQDPEPQSL